jgi:putative SOS response-associated peptidase YedK
MIEEYFTTVSGEEDWTPRYNIAPTQSVPVIRQNPKEPRRELSLMRWGLIPSWAKDARSENLAQPENYRVFTFP